MKQNIHSVLTREFLDVLDCKIQCGWLIVGESAIQRYLARIQIERKCKGDPDEQEQKQYSRRRMNWGFCPIR